MDQITHETLFNYYQHQLSWINRRLTQDNLDFYHEKAENWKHAKEIVFNMYEYFRYYVEGGIPNYKDNFIYDKELVKDIPAYKQINKVGNKEYVSEFPAIGILKYRDKEYPIFDDEYGMQVFIVVNDQTIPIESFGGGYDWYYELDKIIDNID